jgi:hypothetical protein
MNTYKITNITNFAGKRDYKFNSDLDIEYVDNMMKKTVKVKPNQTVFLTVESLPLSVHRLRVKNLVTVTEVSKNELAGLMAEQKKPVPVAAVVQVEVPEEMSANEIKPIKRKKKDNEE